MTSRRHRHLIPGLITLAVLTALLLAATCDASAAHRHLRFKRRQLHLRHQLRAAAAAAAARASRGTPTTSKRIRDFMQRMRKRRPSLRKGIFDRLAAAANRSASSGGAARSRTACGGQCRCEDGGAVVKCTLKSLRRLPSAIPRHAASIDLSYNRLKALHGFQFALFGETLRALHLQANAIARVRPFALSGLKRLATLTLQRNQLRSLEAAMFHGLGQLVTLRLDFNRISFVQPGTFRKLYRLQSLDLDGNRIVGFHADTFATLKLGSYLR